MKIESIVLVSVLALCTPLAARAQNFEHYENRVSCSPGSECTQVNSNKQEQINIDQQEQIDINQQEEIDNDNSQIQRTRTRTRTRTQVSQRDNNYYLGGPLGLLFPGGDGADTGFGGSVLGGRNFGDYWSAELEFFFYAGGTEFDDLGYNTLGVLANVIAKYPFNQTEDNSPYIFGGGGLGYGRVAATGDATEGADDTSESGLTFQLKSGVGYPINEKTDVYGQLRYINVSIDGDNGDGFSIDGGVNFKL
jgi:hypothetical protein